MLILKSSAVLVRIDPAHGAEVLDLIDLRTGRQLLGRMPWSPALPRTGELDGDTWLKSYRGGWQLMVPNAGLPSKHNGVEHGFHGSAGIDVWKVTKSSDTSATLVWQGHGIEVTRTYTVNSDALAVDTTITGLRDGASYVGLEHLTLGTELLQPAVKVQFAGGVAWALPTGNSAEQKTANFPEARLADGSTQRIDRFSLDKQASGLFCVGKLTEGKVTVRNEERGDGIEMTWDNNLFPYCWVWQETRDLGGIWRNQAEVLGIEPSTVPHHCGLDDAHKTGHAGKLNKGQSHNYKLQIRLIPES
jgi:galactose mutarotase-like enzyme